jgi:phage terminase large subunit-like protein
MFELHRKYKPIRVGYEEIALASDMHHIRKKMADEVYHFTFIKLGGRIPKETRIRESLQPYLEAHSIYLPAELMYTNYEGKEVNLTKDFEFEMDSFPVGKHDDMLDALARMVDINLIFPQEEEEEEEVYTERDSYTGY